MRAAGSPPFTAGPVLPLSDLHRLCPSSQVGPAHDTGASPVPAVRARASSAAQTGRHRMLADWNGLALLRALLPQIKTHRKHRKEPGNLTALIASIPQAACGTRDTSYPSRGAQGRGEGAGRERQPGPPFLPALRPGLGPGLRVGAPWLFRAREAGGRGSGRGAKGTAEGRRPGAPPPPSKPWGGRAVRNCAPRKDRQLPSRERKTQEFPSLLMLEERIPHLGQARSAEITVATQSIISTGQFTP